MQTFTTVAQPEFTIGRVDDRVFGSFVEHMGSVVTNGIYQPGHSQSNELGWRMDVLRLLSALGLSVLRYPGGNYTSAYRWEDTVGSDRRATLNLAWREKEPNAFGLHEFFAWKKSLSAEAMLTVNLGTRGALEAADLLEYCNLPVGTKYADMRARNGAPEPFGVKLWCLGNELDGDWQMGHKPAKEYGRLASVTAQLMRQADPSVRLACVGSSNTTLDNYPEWNRKVLMQCYEQVDYITLHKYISKEGLQTPDYLCSPLNMNRMIDTVTGVCDYVAACKRSSKRVNISFDEWNVGPVTADGSLGEWPVGPMRDCISFTLEDALVFAGMFMAILRHADRVRIACQALIVNDIGLVIANEDGAYPNGTYPVFKLLSDNARGTVLATRSLGDELDTDKLGRQPALDTLVVLHEDGSARAFAVNRSESDVRWTVRLGGFANDATTGAAYVGGALTARNSLAQPDAICARPAEPPIYADGVLQGVAPAHSFIMWTLASKRENS